VSWVRNVKAMLVIRLVGQPEPESHRLRNEIKRLEPSCQLFEETAEDKEERFGGFDFILEFDFFAENFSWPNESEKPGGLAGRLLPKPERKGAEAGSQLIRRERGQIAKGVDTPFVQDNEKPGELFSLLGGGLLRWHKGKLKANTVMFKRTC
jgi:hypothetical protein